MPQTPHKACPRGESDCPIYAEVEALRQNVERLASQTRTDSLTGLYNRRHLLDTLQTEMERTLRTDQCTGLILLDIDYFKSVNDRFGHINGDTVLKWLALILQNCVRKIDIVCRFGGEEFAVVLPSTPLLIAAQVAERIRKTIAETPVKLPETSLAITSSLGVTGFNQTMSCSAEELINQADKYLYEAKAKGRNQVCVHPAAKKGAQNITGEERAALFESDKTEEP